MIIVNLFYLVFVNKSLNKVVIGVFVFGLEFVSVGDRGYNLGFFFIKGIDGSVIDIFGSGEVVLEEFKSGFEDGGEWVEVFDKSKFDIDEGDVGMVGGVGSKFEEIFFVNFSYFGFRGWNFVKVYGGEFGGKGSVVGFDLFFGFGVVVVSVEEVEEEEEVNDGENDVFVFEFREGMVFVEVVLFCVGV